MLTNNQAVPYDFSAKDQIQTLDFKYKAGEIDGDGIQILVKGAKIPAGTEILVNWLYSTEEEYIHEQTVGEIISETELKIYPHQNVLIDSSCAFEIIARRGSTWVLKGPTVVVPVVPALIDDEIASEEDENLSVILQLINATRDLNDETLAIETNMKIKNAEYLAANNKYNQDESTRQSTFTTKIAESRTATTNANNAATAANTAATNANTAKTNADNARVAATNAKTAAETAMTNANAAKNEANTASTSANTASGRAETAITNANNAATAANTATTNANNATTAANTAVTNANNAIAEIVAARTDVTGTTHGKLSDRLKADFESLASKIPTNVRVSGIETVTTDNTLEGDIRGLTVKGRTMVNLNTMFPKGVNITGSGLFVDKTLCETSSIKLGVTYTFVYIIDYKDTNNEYKTVELGVSSAKNTIVGHPSFSLGSYILTDITKSGIYCHKVAFSDFKGFKYLSIRPLRKGASSPSMMNFTNDVLILEGDHTNKPLSFFEGLKSAEVSEVTANGVNLVNWDRVTIGKYITHLGTEAADQTREYTDYIRVTKGDVLYCDRDIVTYPSEYSSDKTFIPYTKDGVATYRRFANQRYTVENDGFVRVFLHENSKHAPYTISRTPVEAHASYKENIFTLPEPIILRSVPSGVADEIDFEKGVLIRRCGEVVWDGSEGWSLQSSENLSYISFRTSVIDRKAGGQDILCDRFKNFFNYAEECMFGDGNGSLKYVTILKSKLTTPDVAGFKAWLTANPTTVVYELATPTTEPLTPQQLLAYKTQTTVTADSVVPLDISADMPISFSSSLASASATALALEEENTLLAAQLEQEQQTRKEADIQALQADWEMDDRIYELEWALESAQSFSLNRSSGADLKFEQAKKLIASGAYDEETLLEQLTKYQAKGVITEAHLDTLIAIMTGGEADADN